jgi:DNA-binding CsgD family transcriptional regulator
MMLEPLVSALPLTPRLLDVFFELAVGRPASEIADSLGISKQTAETEIKLLFRRLDVSGHRAVRSIAMTMLLDLARDNAPPPKPERESWGDRPRVSARPDSMDIARQQCAEAASLTEKQSGGLKAMVPVPPLVLQQLVLSDRLHPVRIAPDTYHVPAIHVSWHE